MSAPRTLEPWEYECRCTFKQTCTYHAAKDYIEALDETRYQLAETQKDRHRILMEREEFQIQLLKMKNYLEEAVDLLGSGTHWDVSNRQRCIDWQAHVDALIDSIEGEK